MLTVIRKTQEYIPSSEYELDKNGEFVLDANGNKILRTDKPVTFFFKVADFGDSYTLLNNSKIKQKGTDTEIEQNNMGDYLRGILINCVIDWKNVFDEDGGVIKFDKNNKPDMIGMLPLGLASEVAGHILSFGQTDKEEEKN